jgi:polysaccharide export outer membrane protein
MTISFGAILIRKSVMLWTYVLLLTLPCWAQKPHDGDKAGHGTTAPGEMATARKDAPTPIAGSKAPPRDDSFVISADDVLAVNVWKEAEVSRTVTVRSDGKISLPLVGELQASAKTPKQLEDEIGSRLSGFISEPAVTVIVQEVRSHRFNILGRVEHPGSYPVTESATVLDAIAIAGGFRDFAKQKSIFILRNKNDGTQTRIPFDYKEVISGKHLEQNIKLEPHDTVVVP